VTSHSIYLGAPCSHNPRVQPAAFHKVKVIQLLASVAGFNYLVRLPDLQTFASGLVGWSSFVSCWLVAKGNGWQGRGLYQSLTYACSNVEIPG
jgi:hypothetical protein